MTFREVDEAFNIIPHQLKCLHFPTYKKGANKSAFFSLVKWIGNGYLNYINYVQGAFTPQKEPKIKKTKQPNNIISCHLSWLCI